MKANGAAGLEFLAIPGPSVIPPQVLRAMSHPMTDIYAGELVDVTDSIFERLPPVAGSTGELFITIGNGHAAWEMALSNSFSRGDRVLVLDCGMFAAVWGQMATKNGLIVEQIDAEPGHAVDPDVLERRLAADGDHSIAAVLCVHSDTASSARNDISALRGAIDAAGHPAMLYVDCIASLGCDPVDMDAWGADLVVAACQKGLMTPPGLAFNLVGERALAAHATADLVTYYWDWTQRLDRSAHYLRYCGTPPVSHLYALSEALDMIAAEGLPARYQRHAALAAATHAAVQAWSESAGFSLVVPDPTQRSHSVTTIATGTVSAKELRSRCADLGVVLGIGLGDSSDRSFRIGHMGYVNAPMLLGTLAAIDAALTTIGVVDPATGQRSGAAAAAEVLSAAAVS